jgi:hypothetical protein
MRKLFAVLGLLALAVTPVFADDQMAASEPLNTVSTTVDTAPALLIYYIGEDTTAAVTVQIADDTWTLLQGGAADTTIECPLSGAYGGLLDVTNAACDTVEELMDVVNTTSGSEWRIVPITAFADDDTDNLVLAKAATEARGDGTVVVWDDSARLDHRVTFIPGEMDDNDVKPEFFDPARNGQLRNPFNDATQVLKYAHYNITSGGTMTDLTVTCLKTKYVNNDVTFDEDVIYLEADPTTGVTGLINEFNYAGGGLQCEGGQIIIHLPTDTNLTAPQVVASGYVKK